MDERRERPLRRETKSDTGSGTATASGRLSNGADDHLAVSEKPPGVEANWGRLLLAGGVSAWLYIVLALVVPGVMVATVPDFWDILVDGHRLLEFIGDDRQAFWYATQALVLISSIFAIIAFVAVAVALWNIDRVNALIGAIVGVVAHVLFMAYFPVLVGMVYLADEYTEADTARRDVLASAAEALIAQNSGFNPIYEPLMGAGVLFCSLAMLKGTFSKTTAALGIATFVASVAGVALYPVIGLAYFFWWAFFVAWLAIAGWELVRMGRTLGHEQHPSRGSSPTGAEHRAPGGPELPDDQPSHADR